MNDLDPAASPAAIPDALAATYVPAHHRGFLERAGARLRHAGWNVSGTAAGSVVLLSGRGEFIEKYATEVVGELLGRDLAVFAMDWRGQGLSDRPLADRGKGHVDSFSTYMADLGLFLDRVVVPEAPRPIVALCHSMGAHITLRWLSENGSGPFSAAVLSSPMTRLKREAMLRAVLMLAPEVPAIDRHYLLGSGPFVPSAEKFNGNVVTHDERRYRFTEQWFAADPRLALGGPTFGWARQAIRSMSAAMVPGYLERIGLPVVVVSAGGDPLIDPDSHAPIAARLARGRHVTVTGAKHELMMETDSFRAQFWQAFDGIANGVTGR